MQKTDTYLSSEHDWATPRVLILQLYQRPVRTA